MMEGIGYAADSPAAADLDNLCCVAIRCWDELEEVIAAVGQTGRYDRSRCEHEGLRGEIGYTRFDPATEEGRLRWMQLRRLSLAYFKCPVSRLMQKKRSKEDYRKLKQGKLSMREFVTLDDKMAREVKQAGVQMSDQTRIELVEEKISSSALEAMEKHKDMKITLEHGSWVRRCMTIGWNIQTC